MSSDVVRYPILPVWTDGRRRVTAGQKAERPESGAGADSNRRRDGPGSSPFVEKAGRWSLVSQPSSEKLHLAYRPIWCCRTCGAPWPCGPARLALLAEYRDDPIGLSVYLCAMLHDAAGDLYRLNPYDGPNPRELFERFVAWARRNSRIDLPRNGKASPNSHEGG